MGIGRKLVSNRLQTIDGMNILTKAILYFFLAIFHQFRFAATNDSGLDYLSRPEKPTSPGSC